jgi:multicomponent Na+:H+ antiporter subunit C
MIEIVLSIVVGVLFATGLYMLMRRSAVKLVIGIGLLGHAINLMLFTIGRVTRGYAPIIHGESDTLSAAAANPVPQALILTAIVIGFGVLAFFLALIREVLQSSGTGDVQALRLTDRQLFKDE